ncbi:unnamed protein product, partial [Ixodes hexagonus]
LQRKRGSYSLPDGSEFVVGAVKSSFRCRGSGYFADVDNRCQVFHVCHEMPKLMGPPRYQLYSFMCGNMTVFDQLTLTCTYPDDAVPCASAPDFYAVNDNIGHEDSLFLTDEEVGRAAQWYEEEDDDNRVREQAARDARPKQVVSDVAPVARTERPLPVTTGTTTTSLPPTITTRSYQRYTTAKYRRSKRARKQYHGAKRASTASAPFIEGHSAKPKKASGRGSRRKQARVPGRSQQLDGSQSTAGDKAKPRRKEGSLKKPVIRSMAGKKGWRKDAPGQRRKEATGFRADLEQAPDVLKQLEAAFAQDYPQVTETSYQRIPRKKLVVVPKKKKASPKPVTEVSDDQQATPVKLQDTKGAQKTDLKGLVVLTKDFIHVNPKDAADPDLQAAKPASKGALDGVEAEVPEELMKEIEKALSKQLEGALASGERQATFSKELLMKEIEESLKKEFETGSLKKDNPQVWRGTKQRSQSIAKH